MPEQDNPSSSAESRHSSFSTSRIILSITAIVLAGYAILMTMGPTVAPVGMLVLDKAFVHGAVTQVGIADDARIASLEVDLGDEVAAGDIVATLQSDDIVARLAAADARVARLDADFERAMIDGQQTQAAAEAALAQAEAQITAATARRDAAAAALDFQKGELSRATALAERGIVSESQLADTRENAATARAELERRRAELTVAEASKLGAMVAANRGALRDAERDVIAQRIAEARATRDRISLDLDQTRIDAKVPGVVVDVAARPGASVRPNDTIMSIWNTDRIWMSAWVPEDKVARIMIGDPAWISIDALPGEKFDGSIRRVLIAEDGQERTLPGEPISPLLPDETRFIVQVSFEPDAEALARLLPGMSGEVVISAEDGPPVETGTIERILSVIETGVEHSVSWFSGLVARA